MNCLYRAVAAAGALGLLAACSNTLGQGEAYTEADADTRAALNECRARAAVQVSPAAGGGLVGGGFAGAGSYDLAVAQCLRNIRKSRAPAGS
jgi:hypothetical protein